MQIDSCEALNMKGQGRVLCLDYGNERIGVAMSDKSWTIASPFVVLESRGVFPKLLKILKDNEIILVVIGAPKALNGGEHGRQHERVKKFANKLEELVDIKITFWDERFSTAAADRYILEAGLSLNKRKGIIDKVAASFILQGFLNLK